MTAPKILIVDDSDTIRETLKLTLEFNDYDVTVAADGREGVNLIRQNTYDLVLCDLAMPELDGFGLIKEVRGDLGMPDLPIIILSAEAQGLKQRAIEAGANDSLDKPFAPKDLLAVVERTLRK